jgi:hypothetical protein
MNRKRFLFLGFIISLLSLAVLPPIESSADEMMTLVVGTVTSGGTFVGERGEKYIIGANETGVELSGNEGKKAMVIGYLEEKEGKKILMVTSYQLWSPFGESSAGEEKED